MSRQGHLPPRCPFQKRTLPPPVHDNIYASSHMGSFPTHRKSPSQSSILEEQPAWLDDLLSDQDAYSSGTSLRRSASDPVTLMDGILNSLPSSNAINDEMNVISDETSSGLESACVYGPNSPRSRSSSNFSEKAIVSAFTECASQNNFHYGDEATQNHFHYGDEASQNHFHYGDEASQNHFHYGDESLFVGGITYSSLSGDSSLSAGVPHSETRTEKRHSGQRSRVRKLQYIAELEQTVNGLQTLESDLSVRVASLLRKRAGLSLENSQLKQQVSRLKQKKLNKDGEYQSLKKEAERLRTGLMNSPNSRNMTYFRANNAAKKTARSDICRQLDMTKLNLN